MHVYCVAPMEHLITNEWYTTSYREACKTAHERAAIGGYTTTVSRVHLPPPSIVSIVACLNHLGFVKREQHLLTYAPIFHEDGEGQAPFPVKRTVF
jgi:hypothetical protein